ncbi:MAG: hypothetical protein ACI854_002511 [Arenicella sp.]|jgi:hypothetical protein
MSITPIDLHPDVSFDKDFNESTVDLDKMYNRADRYCFVANTLADTV